MVIALLYEENVDSPELFSGELVRHAWTFWGVGGGGGGGMPVPRALPPPPLIF